MTSENPIPIPDCRYAGLDHAQCARRAYLRSAVGKPTYCQCECHTKVVQ